MTPRSGSRYDRRFYGVGGAVLVGAIAGKLLGADDFDAYPALAVGVGPATIALSVLVALSGLAPLRRRPCRAAPPFHAGPAGAPPVSAAPRSSEASHARAGDRARSSEASRA